MLLNPLLSMVLAQSTFSPSAIREKKILHRTVLCVTKLRSVNSPNLKYAIKLKRSQNWRQHYMGSLKITVKKKRGTGVIIQIRSLLKY